MPLRAGPCPGLPHPTPQSSALIFQNSVIQYFILLSQIDSANISGKGTTLSRIKPLSLSLKAYVGFIPKNRICIWREKENSGTWVAGLWKHKAQGRNSEEHRQFVPATPFCPSMFMAVNILKLPLKQEYFALVMAPGPPYFSTWEANNVFVSVLLTQHQSSFSQCMARLFLSMCSVAEQVCFPQIHLFRW